MDLALTQEQNSLRENIISFARRELNEHVRSRDREHTFPRHEWRRCAEIGIQGLPVPEQYGGTGLDPLSTAIALEALGYGCEDGGLVFSLCAHLLSCVVPIWKHGSEAQKEQLLPRLCDGSLVGVLAMTEPNSGSDAYSIRTSAEPVAGGYRINGTKIFVSNATVADVAIVFAVTDARKAFHGGISAFIVERGAPGFRVGQTFEKMGLHTAPLAEIVCEDVVVGPEALLGDLGAGAAIFTDSMDWERTCLFASQVGTMERLLERSIKHARTRHQFGQTIGKFQAVSHKISDMKLRLEAARLLTYRAAWSLDRSRDASLYASLAKLYVSESLLQTAMDSVQIHGGYGYVAEYDLERCLRDAVAATIYSGTSEMQRNMIARWLGL